jgi:hypothetical protein
MRRREQDRLARMDVDYQRRKELAEFTMRREERMKAAEERTVKKRLKRQKKKQRKRRRRRQRKKMLCGLMWRSCERNGQNSRTSSIEEGAFVMRLIWDKWQLVRHGMSDMWQASGYNY